MKDSKEARKILHDMCNTVQIISSYSELIKCGATSPLEASQALTKNSDRLCKQIKQLREVIHDAQ